MYCGTSRKLRSAAKEAMTPESSRGPSSWSGAGCAEDCDAFRRGLADDGDDTERRRPREEATLCFLDFVTREERAGVIWKDMPLLGNQIPKLWSVTLLVSELLNHCCSDEKSEAVGLKEDEHKEAMSRKIHPRQQRNVSPGDG